MNDFFAFKFPAEVITASPTLHRPCLFLIALQSSKIAFPPALWITTSTPPQASKEVFAAFTITSTSSFVMSPLIYSISTIIYSIFQKRFHSNLPKNLESNQQ
jgi:hypothetical protein